MQQDQFCGLLSAAFFTRHWDQSTRRRVKTFAKSDSFCSQGQIWEVRLGAEQEIDRCDHVPGQHARTTWDTRYHGYFYIFERCSTIAVPQSLHREQRLQYYLGVLGGFIILQARMATYVCARALACLTFSAVFGSHSSLGNHLSRLLLHL